MRTACESVPLNPRRASRWLGPVCAMLGLCACHVYRAKVLPKAASVAEDASQPDAESDASAADANVTSSVCERGRCWWSQKRDGCDSVGFPGVGFRPSASSAASLASSDSLPIYFGLNTIQMGTAANGLPVGLDIDSKCTSSPSCPDQQTASCQAPLVQRNSDGEGCRDNAFADVMAMLARIPQLAATLGVNDDEFNCELWRGSYNLLFRLTGYNGASADESLRVDWYTSAGIEQEANWRCPEPDFAIKHARWPSSAVWRADTRALLGSVTDPGTLPDSRMSDPHAYVRGGYLVSRLPDGSILRLIGDAQPFRGFAMPVYGAVWLGHLTRTVAGEWTVSDGLIAGRVRAQDLLQSFQDVGLCKGGPADPFVDSVASYIAAGADVLASAEAAREQACDALSFGIAFTASQVTPGQAQRESEPPAACCELAGSAQNCMQVCGDGEVSGSEQCDTGIAANLPGACPTDCPASSACETSSLEGAGCSARCVDAPIRAAVDGDGCCPPGASSQLDSDCSSKCGNAVIEPGETCDPPSACPSCVTDDKCLRLKITGSAATCDLVCTVTSVSECRSEDGCCPETCTSGADDDCSTRCGNGRVDPGTSETCEYTAAPACPLSCDDGDPCTSDIKTGSPANCNVRCSHFRVVASAASDACCPSGADGRTDPDCAM
jgi:hypothetical protein